MYNDFLNEKIDSKMAQVITLAIFCCFDNENKLFYIVRADSFKNTLCQKA